MRIREGDPLEIFTNRDGEVIFKKYSPVGELGDYACGFAEVLSKTVGRAVCVTDKDSVIAVAGAPTKEFADKRVSNKMEDIINSRTAFSGSTEDVELIEGDTAYTVGVAVPIISEGDTVGTVAILSGRSEKPLGEVEQKLASAAAGIIGKQMES